MDELHPQKKGAPSPAKSEGESSGTMRQISTGSDAAPKTGEGGTSPGSIESEANKKPPAEIDESKMKSMDRDENIPTKRRKLMNLEIPAAAGADASSPAPPLFSPVISLRKLIPPKDCARMRSRLHQPQHGVQQQHLDATAMEEIFNPSGKTGSSSISQQQSGNVQFDWSSVVARAKTHPQEATQSYFGPVKTANVANTEKATSTKSATATASAADSAAATNITINILTYKPLHAMLKYDPPLEAVEAVLRAHPEAVLDVTFEGSALKIASESRVSSMLVLRLLLVAEMAMRKKLLQQQQEQQQNLKQNGRQEVGAMDQGKVGEDEHMISADKKSATKATGTESESKRPTAPQPTIQVDPLLTPPDMFLGHNPIRWITERRIPVKTAAMLLKWYPIGGFQRPRDNNGVTSDDAMHYDIMEAESPLIEIVDDFARDHYDEGNAGRDNDEEDGYESDDDYDDLSGGEHKQPAMQTHQQRERLRKEKRWEKFLHILYATNLALQSTKRQPASNEEGTPPVSPKPTSEELGAASVTAADSTASKSEITSKEQPAQSSSNSNTITPFRPVHAWIRCLTSPLLGLENCRPYGVWSVLRVMGQRIPSEFTVRDTIDGNRTVFQTLAESPSSDCKLCLAEVKDIVECLIDADHRSAFL